MDSWEKYRWRMGHKAPVIAKSPIEKSPKLQAKSEPAILVEWPAADNALMKKLEDKDSALANNFKTVQQKLADHYAKVVKLEFPVEADQWRPGWHRQEQVFMDQLSEIYATANKLPDFPAPQQDKPTTEPTVESLKRRQPKPLENYADNEAKVENSMRIRENRDALMKAVEDFRQVWKTYLNRDSGFSLE